MATACQTTAQTGAPQRRAQETARLISRIRLSSRATLLTGCLLGVLAISFSFLFQNHYQATVTAWSAYSATTLRKMIVLGQLRETMGYGGFIHDFKNYVIRRTPQYRLGVERSFSRTGDLIEGYRSFDLSVEEEQALAAVEETLTVYHEMLPIIDRGVASDGTPTEIDARVRVSDRAALEALDTLHRVTSESHAGEVARLSAQMEQERIFVLGTQILFVLVTGLGVLAFFWVRNQERALAHLITELRNSESSYRNMFQSSGDLVLIHDADGTIETVNAATTDCLGVTADDLVGRNILDVLTSVEGDAAAGGEIEGGVPAPPDLDRFSVGLHEFTYRRGVDDVIAVEGSFAAFPGVDGRKFIAILRDITIRKQAERSLAQAWQAAIAGGEAKDRFIANMSHELRTPLNAIIGFSTLMQDAVFGALGNRRYAEYVTDIRASGEHLLQIVNDVLDLSATEVGKLHLDLEQVDVAALVVEVLRQFEPAARAKGIVLNQELPSHDSELICDRRRMRQILLNLLSNAVKFTGAGGTIRVILRWQDGAAELSVEDDGVGMTALEIAIAETSFGQVDSGLDRRHEGTGLGLPLVRSFAEAHGASFHLQSQKGVGTRATVRFPSP